MLPIAETESPRVSNRVVQLTVSLLIGLVVGGLAGRWTAPSIPSDLEATLRVAPKTPSGRGFGDVASLIGNIETAVRSDAAKDLAAVSGILSAATASDLLDWGRAPEDVSRRIINEMSDNELISTITSLTKLTAEDLEGYSDLRDYANRLTHIGLSGVITPELSEDFGHDGRDVNFSTGASSSSGARDPRFEFEESARKIYAVIPNDENTGDSVMVHWYRIDQPEIMLLDQFRVSPADNFSFVWLKSPPDGWGAGQYRVEFFSPDEFLTPIASGTYNVVAD